MKKFLSLSLLSLSLFSSVTTYTNELVDEIMHARQATSFTEVGTVVEATTLDELIQNVPEEVLDKPVEPIQRSKSREMIQKLALVALSSYLYIKTKVHGMVSFIYSFIAKP